MKHTLENINVANIKEHADRIRTLDVTPEIEKRAQEFREHGYNQAFPITVSKRNGTQFLVLKDSINFKAAKLAGLKSVPCVVMTGLSAEEEFFLLIEYNRQKGLSHLEIGLYGLSYVEKHSGGRGKEGGISEFGRKLDFSSQRIHQIVTAAEVFLHVNALDSSITPDTVHKKTAHLTKIGEGISDKNLWLPFLKDMLDYKASVETLSRLIGRINAGLINDRRLRNVRAYYNQLMVNNTLDMTRPPANSETGSEAGETVPVTSEAATPLVIEQDIFAPISAYSHYHSPDFALYKGDCIDVLMRMPANSVNVICTDPPYGGNFVAERGSTTQGIAQNSPAEFEALIGNVIPQFARVLTEDGVALICCSGGLIKNVGQKQPLQIVLDACRQHFQVEDVLPWFKDNGSLRPLPKYTKSNEMVIVVRKTAGRHFRHLNVRQADFNTLFFPRVPGGAVDHPTPKPLLFMAKLLRQNARPGDLVVDPFNGGGSTGLACKKLGYKYIGIDLEQNHLNTTVARLNNLENECSQELHWYKMGMAKMQRNLKLDYQESLEFFESELNIAA